VQTDAKSKHSEALFREHAQRRRQLEHKQEEVKNKAARLEELHDEYHYHINDCQKIVADYAALNPTDPKAHVILERFLTDANTTHNTFCNLTDEIAQERHKLERERDDEIERYRKARQSNNSN
jgi:hypothetical protein